MSHTFQKPKSIISDARNAFGTSRRLQWTLVAMIILIPLGAVWLSDHRREQAKTEKAEHSEKTYIESLFDSKCLASGTTGILLGINSKALPESLDATLAGGIRTRLRNLFPDHTFAIDAFRPAFYLGEHFASAFSGDMSELQKGRLLEGSKGLVLIDPSVRFSDASVGGSLISCRIDLAIRSFSPSGEPAKESSLSLAGTGFSQSAALKVALTRLDDSKKEEFRSAATLP